MHGSCSRIPVRWGQDATRAREPAIKRQNGTVQNEGSRLAR